MLLEYNTYETSNQFEAPMLCFSMQIIIVGLMFLTATLVAILEDCRCGPGTLTLNTWNGIESLDVLYENCNIMYYSFASKLYKCRCNLISINKDTNGLWCVAFENGKETKWNVENQEELNEYKKKKNNAIA